MGHKSIISDSVLQLAIIEDKNALPIMEHILATYTVKIRDELLNLLAESGEEEIYDKLEEYLRTNWDFVKRTALSYTAIPRAEVTLLLIKIAKILSQHQIEHRETNEPPMLPIEFLMPNSTLESSKHGFSHLNAIEPSVWTDEDEEHYTLLYSVYFDKTDVEETIQLYQQELILPEEDEIVNDDEESLSGCCV